MEFFQANIHLKEVFVQLLAFVIVFWTLKAVAWKPVLELLRSRREKIETELGKISDARRELESLKAEYQKKLGHIEEEARAKIQEALTEGKKLAREVQDSARTQAKEILEKSKEDIELEAKKARAILRKEIAGLVFAATERLIREKCTEKKDEELIFEFIRELDSTKEHLA